MDVVFDAEKLGQAVRKKRMAQKSTLRELSGEVGVSAATINRAEKFEMLNVHTLCCLCGWLKVSPNRFFEILK